MFAFALAALMTIAPVQTATPQSAPVAQSGTADGPVRLEDIEVTGAPLDTLIRDFVNEVAAPNRDRGIARWEGQICVGVANLRTEPAQYIVDRVSTVAEDVGLTPGQPGCMANVIIIATDEPDRLAEELVRERRRAFRMGGAGMDRGGTALNAFIGSDQPVRWWQVSMPIDSQTGSRAVRLPGECKGSCDSSPALDPHPEDYAPVISTFAASRLSTQIVDNLFRTVVIVDVDQLSSVSTQQLADYLAMITLAQIDPTADTSRYASILNVFEDPDSAQGLTDWDEAYLLGLYQAERTRKNLGAGRSEISSSIRRAHGRLTTAEPD
ncbi:hypothetical protein [uncultured Brevundimonas sp.]|uniref:hypothetical protein n=1 Tax=uncultured Brevundimonas sp. TaxID=213418 RepID=UPI0030ECB0D5|tara:strand:- start:296 stop:1267 length:972 start_codon:yes stop_codon:yes gene_type:complete